MKHFALPKGKNPLIVAYEEGVLGRSSRGTAAEITDMFDRYFPTAFKSPTHRPPFERVSLVDPTIRTFVCANTEIAKNA